MADDSSSTPEFSIITICRNEADGIERTCESIIDQEHRDFEWIVVDGASTDGTLDIVRKYESHLSLLISESDGGIYEAMNKGISLSRGKIIAFMNGGDVFSSSEVIKWVAEAPKVDLIYGQLELDEPGGELMHHPEKIHRDYLLRTMLHHQASFFRRELFERFGGYDTSFRIAGDYDFFVRIMVEESASHHYVAKPFAVFNRRGISCDKKYRHLRKSENHRIRMQYFPEYRTTAKAWRQRLRDRLFARPTKDS